MRLRLLGKLRHASRSVLDQFGEVEADSLVNGLSLHHAEQHVEDSDLGRHLLGLRC